MAEEEEWQKEDPQGPPEQKAQVRTWALSAVQCGGVTKDGAAAQDREARGLLSRGMPNVTDPGRPSGCFGRILESDRLLFGSWLHMM